MRLPFLDAETSLTQNDQAIALANASNKLNGRVLFLTWLGLGVGFLSVLDHWPKIRAFGLLAWFYAKLATAQLANLLIGA